MIDPTEAHRPKDRRGFISAAVAMRAQGLKVYDVAVALRLTPNAVADLLYEYDHGEPRHGTAVAHPAPGRKP